MKAMSPPCPNASGSIQIAPRSVLRLQPSWREVGNSWSSCAAFGQEQALARGDLELAGEDPDSATKVPNAPGEVTGDGLTANVAIDEQSEATEITFELTDDAGQPVDELEPYLGAMGYLVIFE